MPPPIRSWNSDYVGYRILYKEWMSDSTFQLKELPLGSSEESEPQYIIEGLSRFKHYLVQVQAFNRQGSSPSAKPVFVYVGYSAPKQPIKGFNIDVESSTQLKLRWDEWREAEPINGFKVNPK